MTTCPTCSCEISGAHKCPHTKAPTPRELDRRLTDAVARIDALEHGVGPKSVARERVTAIDPQLGADSASTDALAGLKRPDGIDSPWQVGELMHGSITAAHPFLKSAEHQRLYALQAERLARGLAEERDRLRVEVDTEMSKCIKAIHELSGVRAELARLKEAFQNCCLCEMCAAKFEALSGERHREAIIKAAERDLAQRAALVADRDRLREELQRYTSARVRVYERLADALRMEPAEGQCVAGSQVTELLALADRLREENERLAKERDEISERLTTALLASRSDCDDARAQLSMAKGLLSVEVKNREGAEALWAHEVEERTKLEAQLASVARAGETWEPSEARVEELQRATASDYVRSCLRSAVSSTIKDALRAATAQAQGSDANYSTRPEKHTQRTASIGTSHT